MLRHVATLCLVVGLSGCAAMVLSPGPVRIGPAERDYAADVVTRAVGPEGQLLNAQRAAAALPALQKSALLTEVAQGHLQDMARNVFFSHVSSDGTTLRGRVEDAGYCYRKLAENIAMGQHTVDEVFDGWMDSPGHRRNILQPELTDYGFAGDGAVYVLVLGRGC